ncbi:hypothetical protein C1706_09575 [Propioniciclava flava]|uniref:DUF3618 domain-containing protein n=1 Tax=Propioniciclava flava TaxID=2072026 RepID=A0A4V1Q7A9_9ACTN|nr:hypothetical protein C1706_09575 [Propioniciclava flava]
MRQGVGDAIGVEQGEGGCRVAGLKSGHDCQPSFWHSGRRQRHWAKGAAVVDGTSNTARIEADIAAARTRLASNIEGLITQSHPKVIVARSVEDAKQFVADEVGGVKAQFVNPDGSLKTARALALAAALIGGVAFLVVVRSLARGN